MVERITGPVRGYYIAAYANPVGEAGTDYAAYYKVCSTQPRSYFDPFVCLIKGMADPVTGTPVQALDLAIESALQEVGNLPHAQELPATREGRRLYLWEAWQFGIVQ